MKTHLKQLLVALFATILVCSTIIGIGCYSHAKNDASLLTKANVEAMSFLENNTVTIAGYTFEITGNVGTLLAALIQWVIEQFDGEVWCRWHSNEAQCLWGNRISFRPLCDTDSPDDDIRAVLNNLSEADRDNFCKTYFHHRSGESE